jgi:metal-responsive CopG/Arc/MetJ family transcriptional regulator
MMKPIQILMDERLLAAVDREAKRRRSDRSKLVRAALTAFLADSRRRTLEEQYRRAYRQAPQRTDEIEPWEHIQAWPED